MTAWHHLRKGWVKGKERRMFWLSKLIPREAAGCVAQPPAVTGKAQGDEPVGTSGIHFTFRCLYINGFKRFYEKLPT